MVVIFRKDCLHARIERNLMVYELSRIANQARRICCGQSPAVCVVVKPTLIVREIAAQAHDISLVAAKQALR